MALLTAAAIEGYREYTRRTVAYAMYRVAGVLHRANISSITALPDGRLAIDFTIDHTLTGDITVTEVQLYNTSGVLWLNKTENIVRRAVQEGILYRFTFTIQEG